MSMKFYDCYRTKSSNNNDIEKDRNNVSDNNNDKIIQ